MKEGFVGSTVVGTASESASLPVEGMRNCDNRRLLIASSLSHSTLSSLHWNDSSSSVSLARARSGSPIMEVLVDTVLWEERSSLLFNALLIRKASSRTARIAKVTMSTILVVHGVEHSFICMTLVVLIYDHMFIPTVLTVHVFDHSVLT